MAFVSVLNETVYEDGGYIALVRSYGVEYAVHYIASEIRVSATQSMQYDRSPRWQKNSRVKAVRDFADWRVGMQSPEWHAAHKALYAEEEA